MRPNITDCHNPKEIKLITRLRHSQSHLHERKLKYCFQDFVILIALAGMRLKQLLTSCNIYAKRMNDLTGHNQEYQH